MTTVTIKPVELVDTLAELSEALHSGRREFTYALEGLERIGKALDAVTVAELTHVFIEARARVVNELLQCEDDNDDGQQCLVPIGDPPRCAVG